MFQNNDKKVIVKYIVQLPFYQSSIKNNVHRSVEVTFERNPFYHFWLFVKCYPTFIIEPKTPLMLTVTKPI